ncbi:zinc finger BED-type containing 9 [Chelydra serpentina]|uniref:Zinc finger BED-type containing 9 n=1 Tax=Chelydra serpentina TaxID=8475 RepID=A0A8T1S5H2_CHESE|nr:zinc finger BED-type containing 9 [Chelydra serpentina]
MCYLFQVLGNDSMKPAKLKLHLEMCHRKLLQKEKDYLERRLSGLKRPCLDSTGAFYKNTSNAVTASYIVAYKIAQAKKPHTVVEQLVLSCAKEMLLLVLGEEAARKLKDISVSNDTISRQINEISQNINEQVVDEIKKSPLFAIQLDESTDITLCSQLLVFARYMVEGDFKDEFLFCKTLDTITKAQDVMEIVNNFFEVHGLDWTNLVGVTTDGPSAMLGSRSGFQTLVKQHTPMVTRGNCFINREALASKRLPDQLNAVFKGLVKVVNCMKSSSLNTRLFKRFCQDMGSDFDVLLFYTSVRWLSAGNVLNRVFQLREELDLFLQAQGKEEFRNVLMQSNLEFA